MGLAGFITSLVGIVSCGLICPIGAVLSFIGCFRQPRGFAIAGLIIGLIGSVWLLVLFFVIGAAGLVAILVALGVGGFGEVGMDMDDITERVQAYFASTGVGPATLTDVGGLSQDQLTDPWGTWYVYQLGPNPGEFTLTSAGPDAAFDTHDDIRTTEEFDPFGP
jgi:hypothetical protein